MSRYWNQSRPKYINGEPERHLEAKQKVADAMHIFRGYIYEFEKRTIPLFHKDNWISFPIDIWLWNEEGHNILVQLDGKYHQDKKIQIGKTKNRNDTLQRYADRMGYKYVVLDVDDVLNQDDDNWLLSEIFKERIYNE
jgi:hypothetical protein